MVIADIRTKTEAVSLSENKMLQLLEQSVSKECKQSLASARLEISTLQRRLKELTEMTAKLYEDKISGAISADTFQILVRKQEQERAENGERLEALTSEVEQAAKNKADKQAWSNLIRKHAHLQDLDRKTIDDLIDYIEIGKTETVNGKRIRNITIHYRFIDLAKMESEGFNTSVQENKMR